MLALPVYWLHTITTAVIYSNLIIQNRNSISNWVKPLVQDRQQLNQHGLYVAGLSQ